MKILKILLFKERSLILVEFTMMRQCKYQKSCELHSTNIHRLHLIVLLKKRIIHLKYDDFDNVIIIHVVLIMLDSYDTQ